MTLGRQAGACFNAIPPSVQFLLGPLEQDYTPSQRRRRQQRQVDESEEEDEEEQRPDEVKKQKTAQNIMEKQMKECTKALIRESKKQYDKDMAEIQREYGSDDDCDEAKKRERAKAVQNAGKIPLVNALWNHKSFTQTVENLFHLSFMVKEGRAELGTTDEGTPTFRSRTNMNMLQADHPPSRQAIISLNMKDWRALTEAYEAYDHVVPNRRYKRHKSMNGSQDDGKREAT